MLLGLCALALGIVLANTVRMARSLWKGWLSFGLVNIPVEVHTAVRDHRPRFRMLHAEGLSPVKFERVCAREGIRSRGKNSSRATSTRRATSWS